MVAAEREREVAGEHREDDRQRQVVVVHRALLRAQPGQRVRLAALLLRADELPVRRDDHEEDVRGHDRPEHRADLEVGRARGEELARGERGDDHERRDRDRDEPVLDQEAAGGVVDEPGEREPGRRQRHRLPGAEVGDGRVDEPRVGVEPVEDDEQREAGEPGRVRLPLEPVQVLGQLAAARPCTSASGRSRRRGRPSTRRRRPPSAPAGGAQAEVEPDEVEGRADPGDPGDDVQEPQDEVGEVSQVVRVHRSLAIAQSARRPVSSSSPACARAARAAPAAARRACGRRRRRRTRSRSGARTPRSGAPAPRAPRARRRAAPPRARRCAGASRARRPDRPRAARAPPPRRRPSGSARAASSSTSRVRPENSGVSSATLSCRGSSRTSRGRRAAGRGSGRRRGRPRARRA